jgi:GGDEF domain-containing protein
MTSRRVPRQIPALDSAPSQSARRLLYERASLASGQSHDPQASIALVLVDVSLAPGSEHFGERFVRLVTTKLAGVFDRRLRSVDMLARSADTELAVLLAHAHLGVAAAFSERLRQPIEQALRDAALADEIVVCMGLAASPAGGRWHPDALIELVDFRMLAARRRARASPEREWALAVDGESVPPAWADTAAWPATAEFTSHSGL